ncbi:MAG TPA: twin-arginine translocase subunit TatC [Ignavibacteria bacterium]|nr:twin-arginine translocase subunit TatC [Ignavibacteria bacterium]
MSTEDNEMSFFDHLEEFRSRLIKSIIGAVIGAIIVGIFSDYIITDVLLKIAKNTNPPMNIINLKPYGQLSLYFEVIIIGGLILSFPVIIYQFWKFIEPALRPSERKFTLYSIIATIFCFIAGVIFIYYVLLPTALNFFAQFGSASINNQIAVDEYMSFILTMMFTGGLVFELPVISFFLGKIGILKPAFMRKYRRHAIVVILIIAGVVTPGPDVASQLLLGIPLILLYEISIFVNKIAQKKHTEVKDIN